MHTDEISNCYQQSFSHKGTQQPIPPQHKYYLFLDFGHDFFYYQFQYIQNKLNHCSFKNLKNRVYCLCTLQQSSCVFLLIPKHICSSKDTNTLRYSEIPYSYNFCYNILLFSVTNIVVRASEIAQPMRMLDLAALEEDCIQFPAPTQQLTKIGIPVTRDLASSSVVHICRQNKTSYT